MKTIDQLYCCQLSDQVFGIEQLQCRLRIFKLHAEVQTVMITAMRFEMGWFIPYVVGRLIEQVVKKFSLDPAKLIWVEHYTPTFRKPTLADFSQVTFEWHDGQATNLRWAEIPPKTVQALINEAWLPTRR